MLELVLFKAATRHTLDNNFSLSFLSPRTFNMDILLLSKEAIKTTRRLSDTNCEEIQLQPVFFVFIFVTVHSFRKHCCSQFQVLSLQEKKKKAASCLMQNQKKTQFRNTDHVNLDCLGWTITLWWSATQWNKHFRSLISNDVHFQRLLSSFC